MPMYEYRCEACGVDFERSVPMSQMYTPEQEPCSACQALEVKKVILTAPGLADPVRLGIRKPDNGFKEVLAKVHERTPGSTLKGSSTHF